MTAVIVAAASALLMGQRASRSASPPAAAGWLAISAWRIRTAAAVIQTAPCLALEMVSATRRRAQSWAAVAMAMRAIHRARSAITRNTPATSRRHLPIAAAASALSRANASSIHWVFPAVMVLELPAWQPGKSAPLPMIAVTTCPARAMLRAYCGAPRQPVLHPVAHAPSMVTAVREPRASLLRDPPPALVAFQCPLALVERAAPVVRRAPEARAGS